MSVLDFQLEFLEVGGLEIFRNRYIEIRICIFVRPMSDATRDGNQSKLFHNLCKDGSWVQLNSELD